MSVPLRWQEPEIVHEPLHARRVPVRPAATRSTKSLGTTILVWASVVGVLCAGVGFQVGRFNGINEGNLAVLHLVSSPSTTGKVLLSNANVERRLGFVTVTGNVLSRTHESLSNVEMVVELLDAQNRTLKVQSALIGADPLTAGSTSSFTVAIEDDSHAVRYRVRPRKMFGGMLD